MTDFSANGALYRPELVEDYLAMLFRHVDWQPGQVMSLLGIGEKGTAQEGKFRERQIIPPAFIGVSHGHLKRWAEHRVAGFIVPAVLHAAAQDKGDVTLDKIAALTAIVLDLDSGDIAAKAKYVTDRLGRPTMIVASGGKTEEGKLKAHLYWLLSEPSEEVERVAALRKLLAAKVGGDQSFGRATQVVRVPGSIHAKHGNATVCTILDRGDGDYDLDELAEIIEGMAPMPGIQPAKPDIGITISGGMDFTPRQDTALAALHRDIDEGGDDLTRWGEFSKVAGFNISEARAGRLLPEAAYTATNGWMLEHMNPPWPQARFDTEFRALVNKDVAGHGPFPQAVLAAATLAANGISPTPASWPIASSIPPRPWLLGHWFQRGIVTAVIAPGGIGKSSLMVGIALSMASGKAFLGKDIFGGPKNVWMWNLEDSGMNLARARVAAAIFHRISEVDCGGRLFVDSGPDGATLCVAKEDRSGFAVNEQVLEAIVAALKARKIDLLIIDPLVSSHQINENDNNMVDAVVKAWARVAQAANCAVALVHHSVKMKGETVTADSARGASALNNAARMTLVLNQMTPDQADTWGVDHISAKRYFSVMDDKHNMSPAEQADWFKLESQSLNNGDSIHDADSIGVVTTWKPPRAMDGVQAEHLFQIQLVIEKGNYRKDSTVTKEKWAGEVVSNVLKITLEPKSKKRIGTMIDTWIGTGALKVEPARDPDSKLKDYVRVGHWAGDRQAFTNLQNGVSMSDMETDNGG